MDVRLDGRSAVITGGSKGLGLAIAEEYARSGADVAILARDQGTLNEAKARIERTFRSWRPTRTWICSTFRRPDLSVSKTG